MAVAMIEGVHRLEENPAAQTGRPRGRTCARELHRLEHPQHHNKTGARVATAGTCAVDTLKVDGGDGRSGDEDAAQGHWVTGSVLSNGKATRERERARGVNCKKKKMNPKSKYHHVIIFYFFAKPVC